MKIIHSTPLKTSRWPWPKIDVEDVAKRALLNDIYMPNIGFINIGDTQAWSAELGSAANSKKLWLNSLVTPHACLTHSKEKGDENYYGKAIELISAYLNQYDSAQGLFDVSWKDEHAVSNRLFVLTAFIHALSVGDDSSLSQLEIIYHAERHAKWLSNDDHYVKNNHGVMMDLALAQYAVLIRELDPKQAGFYLSVALNRLSMMLEDTFDAKGCCTENSPTYHFVNYSLFLSIFSFLKEYVSYFDLDCWEETLEKAESVGALLLRPDGTIPLVGDSERQLKTFFPKPKISQFDGIGFYPDAGILVISEGDFQFTFRAGGRKFSHRHIDDLSITLWFKGRDFIVDAGLYNYDITDKTRRKFIYSESHSGFYLGSQGHVQFKNFESPSHMSRFTEYNHGDDTTSVTALHNLSSNCEVLRNFEHSSLALKICDSFSSTVSEKWRCQFLLHPDCQVNIDRENGSAVIVNDGVKLKINFKVDDGTFQIKQKKAFYSPSFMDLKETTMLLVEGDDTRLILTSCIELDS